MDALRELQEWYLSQCDDDWEHSYGISIDTLDNPGWSLKIDLKGTALEDVPFSGVKYGVGREGEFSGDDWIACEIKDRKFLAYGGPRKLDELIRTFLNWANGNV